MNANVKKVVMAIAVAGAMTSGSAMAASGTDTSSPYSVANNLDLRIVIPAFLYFRVGTDSATVDQITFSPTAANLGNAAPVAGTAVASAERLPPSMPLTIRTTDRPPGISRWTAARAI